MAPVKGRGEEEGEAQRKKEERDKGKEKGGRGGRREGRSKTKQDWYYKNGSPLAQTIATKIQFVMLQL